MNRIALSHPEIAFRLHHEGNQLLHTAGNGDLRQTIAGVYGTLTAKKMKLIENENLDFKVKGYISLPDTTRGKPQLHHLDTERAFHKKLRLE